MTTEEESIRAFLAAFCNAMQRWEKVSYPRLRIGIEKNRGAGGTLEVTEEGLRERETIAENLRQIFKRYCTTWDDPNWGGRSVPYLLEHFDVMKVSIKGDEATATVRMGVESTPDQPAKWTYYLKRTPDGWRLLDCRIFHYTDDKGRKRRIKSTL